ncbi:hypothetical protein, partial [Trueperella pyogenes]
FGVFEFNGKCAFCKQLSSSIPAWFSGIGGAAALVAVYQTSKAGRQVEQSVSHLASESTSHDNEESGVSWRVIELGAHSRKIVNVGTRAASNVQIQDVTKGGNSGLSLLEGLPREVQPNDGIMVAMYRSIVDPYISYVQIRWREQEISHEATISIS